MPKVRLLLEPTTTRVHEVLIESASLQWSDYKTEKFARKCSDTMAKYQEKFDEIMDIQVGEK